MTKSLAGLIQEVVNERRMPPWHANPEHGDFKNDASLSSEELQLIRHWVDAGAPRGDKKELPEPIAFTEGWQIGEPDVVVAMADEPFQVPATGVVPYQYFVVDPGFTEDKWVKAAECRIGSSGRFGGEERALEVRAFAEDRRTPHP